MSQLFVQTAEKKWTPYLLREGSHDVHVLLLSAGAERGAGPNVAGCSACLVSFRAGANARWMVAAGVDAPLRVNGIPLGGVGIRVLSDRDEIAIPGVGSAYYSSEVLAEVVPFPASDRAVFCGRCRQAIAAGSPAVKCPGCGVWYDQSEELPCWRFSERCAYCTTSTALDAGLTWVPEGD